MWLVSRPAKNFIDEKSGLRAFVVSVIGKGKLDFGTWEQIFYGEFDGKRKKRVLFKIIGERCPGIKLFLANTSVNQGKCAFEWFW